MIITPKMVRIGLFSFQEVKKEILFRHKERLTTSGNEGRPIAIGYQSNSGDLKISANLFTLELF